MQGWEDMELGPGLTIRTWLRIHERLAPETYDRRWAHVITSMRRRLVERFVKPANAVLCLDQNDVAGFPAGRGFAIVALDCLLLETLYGYERGARTQRKETGGAFETTLSQPPFDRWFVPEGRAVLFGRAVRNGVLHDGETRDGWIIWKVWPDDPRVMVGRLPDRRLVLCRDVFHASVIARVNSYFAKLRGKTGADGVELRRLFKRRVDQLCEDSRP